MFYHKNLLRVSSNLGSTAVPESASTNLSIAESPLFDNSDNSEIANNRTIYSPKAEVNAVIAELLILGIAPLPVAPKRDARLPGWHLTNRTQEGHSFCCLDKKGDPVSLFTGKNPSYLDRTGRPRLVKHKDYQTRLPSKTELKEWFAHPDTGVGAMCGHAGITWIDFDTKSYESQENCDQEVEAIIAAHGLGEGWIERTGSGGWRIPVKARQQASFTNFSTVEGGVQRGEALGLGRFTVLAPTVHPNGTPYRKISSGKIPEVESLEAIGIYPAKDAVKSQRNRERSQEWAAVKKERASNQPVTTLVDFLEYDVLPKLDGYQIFNWGGHDFQEYGSTLKGNPPWRQSSSGTSFHVWWDGNSWAWQDKSTGEGGGAVQYRWKLRGGVGTPKGKDFYQIVAELAADAGVTVPAFPTPQSPTSPLPRNEEPDAREYAEYEQWEVEEAEAAVSFGEMFKRAVAKAVNSFKGFGKEPELKPTQFVDNPFDVDVEFEEGDRLKTLRELTQKGHKTILDISDTGTGKSYTIGEATPQDFGVRTIFYTATNHRNPTTEPIRTNYVDLPVRNNGLVEDQQITVNGHPTIRWAVGDEEVNLPGNCPKTALFHVLASKGYNEVSATASENPICNSCVQRFHCVGKFPNGSQAERIEGFTFRQDRRAAFFADRVRASLSSLPIFDGGSINEDESEADDNDKCVALIIDEFDQQFKPTNVVTVTSTDIDATWAAIAKAKAERNTAIRTEKERLEIELKHLKAEYATVSSERPQPALVDITDPSLNLKSVGANALPSRIAASKKKIDNLEKCLATLEGNAAVKKANELEQTRQHVATLERELHTAERQLKRDRAYFDSHKNQREEYRQALKDWQKAVNKVQKAIEETEEKISGFRAERERFGQAIAQIEKSNSLAFLVQIQSLLDGKVPTTMETRFGWNLKQLREIIVLREDPDLEEFFKLLRLAINDILATFGETDGIDLDEGLSKKDRKRLKRSIAIANRKLRSEQNKAFWNYAKNIMPNWLEPFYNVFTGKTPGSLRIRNGLMEIHQPNARLRETILSSDVRIILDATVTRERVARSLGIASNEITVIRQKQKLVPNLTIVQVTGLGHLGGDRSDSKKERIIALQKVLAGKHSSFNVIDHKRTKQVHQGHWFHDNRGSNEFQTAEALALIGDPYNDIDHLLCQYEALTGKETPLEDESFQAFVKEQLQSEVVQGGGRLRPFIRPEEELTLYAVTDQDVSYLKTRFPGATFTKTDAFQICPEAGTRSQRARWGLLEAAKQVVESGAKLTQDAIAATAAISQPMVSKIARQVGGWNVLKKLLHHLLNGLGGVCSTGEGLSDEERWLAKDFLPLLQDDAYTSEEVITEVSQVAQSVGEGAFERILAHTPLQTKAHLLGKLFSILPIDFLDVFADTDMVLQGIT